MEFLLLFFLMCFLSNGISYTEYNSIRVNSRSFSGRIVFLLTWGYRDVYPKIVIAKPSLWWKWFKRQQGFLK